MSKKLAVAGVPDACKRVSPAASARWDSNRLLLAEIRQMVSASEATEQYSTGALNGRSAI